MNMEEIIELIKTGKNDLLEKKLNDNRSLADIKTEQGISLLQFAAYCRNNFAVDILKKHKQKLDIFEAVSIGDTETVSQLLDKNPELLNSFSSDGFTALGLASFFGHLSLVKLLLDKGANPNIASNNQFKVAPIHSACAISHFDIAELLIKHGADVNARQMQDVTPLHSAAHNGQTKISKLLIDNGADINSKMGNGQTPLFMANEKNFKETAELIIKHGGH
ncbi:ankyrin repeat domain-containing protein [Flavobacterium gawalongense]|uniref:Ankyrin repeat domain-containing protein n=2 Tax=Flavobacterium gawalongense TaxID=2594432 RepID=A0A553BLJ6_9FLAO|nr:ankyrin repeat domain-containing protein [Flavobacterium gawalongense]TRX05105.1 ankyrin repeat domain-containing protein [Flavobacterium gawalongense]TRX09115.1 ankyrin repeat domain-containing protein [Flavobacterium gawalongense]TRX10250.1 ankyrin repeat domain-containing protein [Flavobacterium gawalongense]TRX27082.1 ankyrin repeat domain-containing protein [Flavobacterium gawalongense]